MRNPFVPKLLPAEGRCDVRTIREKEARPQGLDPDAPIQIKTSIRIERPPAVVYPLLDLADERYHLRARGNKVEKIRSEPEEYRLWSDLAPNLNFLVEVVDAVEDQRYAYYSRIVPPVGKRIQAHEALDLEPVGEGATSLTYTNTVQNQPGLTKAEFDLEIARSTKSTMTFLTKLKLQAEQGVEAVHAYEREIGHRK